jgi:hypothetical protein
MPYHKRFQPLKGTGAPKPKMIAKRSENPNLESPQELEGKFRMMEDKTKQTLSRSNPKTGLRVMLLGHH